MSELGSLRILRHRPPLRSHQTVARVTQRQRIHAAFAFVEFSFKCIMCSSMFSFSRNQASHFRCTGEHARCGTTAEVAAAADAETNELKWDEKTCSVMLWKTHYDTHILCCRALAFSPAAALFVYVCAVCYVCVALLCLHPAFRMDHGISWHPKYVCSYERVCSFLPFPLFVSALNFSPEPKPLPNDTNKKKSEKKKTLNVYAAGVCSANADEEFIIATLALSAALYEMPRKDIQIFAPHEYQLPISCAGFRYTYGRTVETLDESLRMRTKPGFLFSLSFFHFFFNDVLPSPNDFNRISRTKAAPLCQQF